MPSLFEHAMGPAYQRLDATVRAFHDIRGRAELHGEVETQAPQGALASLLSRLLGAPRRHSQGPIRFELHDDERRQTWTRHFPHRTMSSTLCLQGTALVEALGPARLTFALQEQGGSLVMVLRSMRFLGVPCPRWLLPRISAREQGRAGRLHFDISASVPFVGRVVGYRGWLQLPERA